MTTVLVVDDEEGIRHGLSRLLEREGYRVAAVQDSTHAEMILRDTKIDLAILDMRLKSPMSGLDLLEKSRAKTARSLSS